VGDYLEKIDSETITDDSSEAFTSLYNMLMEKAGSQLGAEYYKEGLASYQSGDYEAAVTALTKAAAYDSTNVDAYFNLANSYRRLEKNDEAIAVYEKIIELFPSTERASRSQSYINELKEAE
jgi:tetratricopeptide (TPR) repeat protein